MKNGAYVNFGTNLVYTDEGQVDMYTQDALEWSCNYNMGEENGTISISVNNVKGFELPRTGGNGTTWFLIIGGVLTAADSFGYCCCPEKERQNK